MYTHDVNWVTINCFRTDTKKVGWHFREKLVHILVCMPNRKEIHPNLYVRLNL